MHTSSAHQAAAPPPAVAAPPPRDPWARLAASPSAATIAGVWGLCEAVWLVVSPAAWLGLIALRAPRRLAGAVARAMVASLAGGMLVFAGCHWAPPRVTEGWVQRVPGVSAADVRAVDRALQVDGLAAIVDVPAGRPFLLEARAAGIRGEPWWRFLGAAALDRLGRLVPVSIALACVGSLLGDVIDRHWRGALVLYALAAAALWSAGLVWW